jgi:hypothetical protein
LNRTGAPRKGSQNDAHRKTKDAGTGGEMTVRAPVAGHAQAAGSAKAGGAKAGGVKAGKGDRARAHKIRAPGDVGQMLRGAYRQTVEEAIPGDLMDLLNKLE